MSSAIQLYYWPVTNGWKISIALEEMGLPYEVRPVDIGAGEQFEPGFLIISPNGRMPAIVDPKGPDGRPISVFESGAVLQYLARKSGKFYGEDERGRVEVEQWLFWQVGGLGPMAGQTQHFRNYAPPMVDDPNLLTYGATRYTTETRRLYGVLNRRLADREFVAGACSIADMAILPWVLPWRKQGQDLAEFPHIAAWFERMQTRPGVAAGLKVRLDLRNAILDQPGPEGDALRKTLFGRV